MSDRRLGIITTVAVIIAVDAVAITQLQKSRINWESCGVAFEEVPERSNLCVIVKPWI